MTKQELKKRFDELVDEYTRQFCEKMYEDSNCYDPETWVGMEKGGIVDICDQFWGFDVIRGTVDEDYNPDEVFAWYDYCLRLGQIDQTITVPNLYSWMKGCPRYSEEQISNLENQIKSIRKSIEDLKEAAPGKECKCNR